MAKKKVQYIKDVDGKRQFAVIPYEDYMQLVKVPMPNNHRREVQILAKAKGWNMVKSWRSYLKFTQVDMAERMEVSPVTYCRLERKVDLNEAEIRSIAKALGISPNQLK